MADAPPTLLCVVPFKSTRGYAWDILGALYARIADHLATHGIPTLVAYSSIPAPPPALAGSAARPIQLDASLSTAASVRATTELISSENVRVVHFIDHPPWCWAYLRLRWAGVKRIIVYDHVSGEFTRPRGLKRAAKWVLARSPGIVADAVVAVSDYVARRQLDVALTPRARLVTIRNGLPVVDTKGASERVRATLGLPPERPLIMCSCRATPEKGVHHLLRAFDRVVKAIPAPGRRPTLIYMGDGPQLVDLRSLQESLPTKDDIILTGYRPDAREILAGADLCVVPSVWQDAFPLAVLEAMARGKPVIASQVGGIPEMVEEGVNGLLVPPADEVALAEAIRALLTDPGRATRLGEEARQRVAKEFSPEDQVRRLTAIVEEGFGRPCAAVHG